MKNDDNQHCHSCIFCKWFKWWWSSLRFLQMIQMIIIIIAILANNSNCDNNYLQFWKGIQMMTMMLIINIDVDDHHQHWRWWWWSLPFLQPSLDLLKGKHWQTVQSVPSSNTHLLKWTHLTQILNIWNTLNIFDKNSKTFEPCILHWTHLLDRFNTSLTHLKCIYYIDQIDMYINLLNWTDLEHLKHIYHNKDI